MEMTVNRSPAPVMVVSRCNHLSPEINDYKKKPRNGNEQDEYDPPLDLDDNLFMNPPIGGEDDA